MAFTALLASTVTLMPAQRRAFVTESSSPRTTSRWTQAGGRIFQVTSRRHTTRTIHGSTTHHLTSQNIRDITIRKIDGSASSTNHYYQNKKGDHMAALHIFKPSF